MTYVIEGRNGERLRVELADGEGVIAEVGKFVYLRGAVEWNVQKQPGEPSRAGRVNGGTGPDYFSRAVSSLTRDCVNRYDRELKHTKADFMRS